MKPFLVAIVAIVVVSAGANVALTQYWDQSAATAFSTDAVRLGDDGAR